MTKQKYRILSSVKLKDAISYELNNKRKLARLITQYRKILSNISKGTAFLRKVTDFNFLTFKTRVILCNTLKKEGRAFRNIGKYIPILYNQPF